MHTHCPSTDSFHRVTCKPAHTQLLVSCSVLPRKLRRPSLHLATSTTPGSAHSPSTRPHQGLHLGAASTRPLSCTMVLLPHDDVEPVMEDKINALIKAAGVNVEPFWPGLFAKALANVNTGSLICNVRADGPAPAEDPAPSTTAAPAEEEKVEAKKEESRV
ncbi:60S acidic ribosomal protein P1-like [Myotis myotis]|uniref:60S acidic ribosomal protein P1-like n=1 Tax=Myotis myotis TaxID=51298 RepID=UPI00174DC887|nr:60S acidic ribosomal protein P1-like [Myotis myotis]